MKNEEEKYRLPPAPGRGINPFSETDTIEEL